MDTEEALQIELVPGLWGRLIYAYAAPVARDALRLTVVDAPATAWRVRQGAVTVRWPRSRRRAWRAGAGEWMLLPPGTRTHEMKPGTWLTSIRFQIEGLDGLPALVAGPPTRRRARDERRLEQATRDLIGALDGWVEPDPERQRFRLVGGRLKESAGRERAMAGRGAWWRWLEAWLEVARRSGWRWRESSAEPGLLARRLPGFAGTTVAALAHHVGLSPAHLRRLAHAELGMAPRAWIDRRRLAEARRQLRAGDVPLKRLAAELGFADDAQFSSWFRRQTGLPPGRWRAQEATGA